MLVRAVLRLENAVGPHLLSPSVIAQKTCCSHARRIHHQGRLRASPARSLGLRRSFHHSRHLSADGTTDRSVPTCGLGSAKCSPRDFSYPPALASCGNGVVLRRGNQFRPHVLPIGARGYATKRPDKNPPPEDDNVEKPKRKTRKDKGVKRGARKDKGEKLESSNKAKAKSRKDDGAASQADSQSLDTIAVDGKSRELDEEDKKRLGLTLYEKLRLHADQKPSKGLAKTPSEGEASRQTDIHTQEAPEEAENARRRESHAAVSSDADSPSLNQSAEQSQQQDKSFSEEQAALSMSLLHESRRTHAFLDVLQDAISCPPSRQPRSEVAQLDNDLQRNEALLSALQEVVSGQHYTRADRKIRDAEPTPSISKTEVKERQTQIPVPSPSIEESIRQNETFLSTILGSLSNVDSSTGKSPIKQSSSLQAPQSFDSTDSRRHSAFVDTVVDALSSRQDSYVSRTDTSTLDNQSAHLTDRVTTSQAPAVSDIRRQSAFLETVLDTLSSGNASSGDLHGLLTSEWKSKPLTGAALDSPLEPDLRRNTAFTQTVQDAVSNQRSKALTGAAVGSAHDVDLRRNTAFAQTVQDVVSTSPILKLKALTKTAAGLPHELDSRRNTAFTETIRDAISGTSLRRTDVPVAYTEQKPQESSSFFPEEADVRRQSAFLDSVLDTLSAPVVDATHITPQTHQLPDSAQSTLPSETDLRRQSAYLDVLADVLSAPYTDATSLPSKEQPLDMSAQQLSLEHDVRRQFAFIDDILQVLSTHDIPSSRSPSSHNGVISQPYSTQPQPSDPRLSQPKPPTASAAKREEARSPEMKALLSTLRHPKRERPKTAWNLFHEVGAPPDLRSPMLAYLSYSVYQSDIPRCELLFNQIQEPTEDDYYHLVKALFKDRTRSSCDSFEKIVQLCHEAEKLDRADKCFHLAFFECVARRDIPMALRIYRRKPVAIGKRHHFEDLQRDCPDLLEALPKSLLWVIRNLESGELQMIGNLEPALNFMMYALVSNKTLLKTALTRDVLRIFDGLHRLSVADTRHYYWAIIGLQRVDRETKSARSLLLYKNYREKFAGLKVPEQVLLGFFSLLSDLESSTGIYTLLRDYRRFYGKPSATAYQRSLLIFARQGKVSDAEKLFEMFIKDYGKPTLKMSTTLIDAYAVLGQVDKVQEHMERLRSAYRMTPDTHVWNILLKAYATNGDAMGTFWTFERMQNDGIQPDVYTFTTLLNVLARRADISTLLDVFQKFKDFNIVLDRTLMKPVVTALCTDERFVAAEALVVDLTKVDLKGSATQLWNVLLWKYAFLADVYLMNRAFRNMAKLGVPANEMTYAALMLALTLFGNTSGAVLILERLHRSKRMRANEFHYAIILLGYLREKNRDMVEVVYKELEDRFVRPDPSSKLSMLRSQIERDIEIYRESGGTESGMELQLYHAEDFLDSVMKKFEPDTWALRRPQPGTSHRRVKDAFPSMYYEQIMKAYASHGAIEKAGEMFVKLKEQQLRMPSNEPSTTPAIFKTLMHTQLHAKDHKALAEVWKVMFKGMIVLATPVPETPSNISQPIIPSYRFSLSDCLSLYMRSLAAQNEYDRIKEVIAEVEDAGFVLTTDNWSLYIRLLCLSDRPEDQLSAFKLFEKLYMRNFPGWKAIVRGYAKRPRDAPPSLDLLEERPLARSKPRDLLGKRGRRAWANIRPDYMQPTYSTMVHLASAYLAFQDRAVTDGGAELSKLGEQATRTLMAIGDMPVLNEVYQGILLRGNPYIDYSMQPKEYDAKSPVWEGGVLGRGGRRVDTAPHELASFPSGTLVPRSRRQYLRPFLMVSTEPEGDEMRRILIEDAKWRKSLRDRLTEPPHESKDIDQIVRREDELDVEDERLFDIYSFDHRGHMRRQFRRRNRSPSNKMHAKSTRMGPKPNAIKTIERNMQQRIRR